jgi:uncharacterized membrane protein YgcG
MRRNIGKVLCILAVCLFLGTSALAEVEYPVLKNKVTDLYGLLSKNEVNQLKADLNRFEKATSNEIAVLITNSLRGQTIEDYAAEVFRRAKAVDGMTGIGKNSLDNGILIVIAPAEKKYRVEVGYGLGGALTDTKAKELAETYLRPKYKEKKYYEAITSLVSAIQKQIGGEYTREDASRVKAVTSSLPSFGIQDVMVLVAFILFLFIAFAVVQAVRKRKLHSIIKQRKGEILSETNSLIAQIDDLAPTAQKMADLAVTFPAWAKKQLTVELSNLQTQQCQKLRDDLESLKSSFGQLTFEEAEKRYGEIQDRWGLILEDMGAIQNMSDKILNLGNELKKLFSLLAPAMDDLNQNIETHKAAGFLVEKFESKIKDFNQRIAKIRAVAPQLYDFGLKDELLSLKKEIADTVEVLSRRVKLRDQNNGQIEKLTKAQTEMTDWYPELGRVLAEIKNSNPAAFKAGLLSISSYQSMPARLEEIGDHLKSAAAKNDMLHQQFDEAANELALAEEKLTAVLEINTDITSLKNKIELARSRIQATYGRTEIAIRNLIAYLRTKGLHNSLPAAEELNQRCRELSGRVQDQNASENWLALEEELNQIGASAAKIHNKAKRKATDSFDSNVPGGRRNNRGRFDNDNIRNETNVIIVGGGGKSDRQRRDDDEDQSPNIGGSWGGNTNRSEPDTPEPETQNNDFGGGEAGGGGCTGDLD